MDSTTTPASPSAPPSGMQGFNKSNRTWTTPADLDGLDNSSRSNGRSSVESTSSRPKTQTGEAPDPAKPASGFSKLLRKRKKKNTRKQTEEALGVDNDRGLPDNRSTESRDGNSGESSLNINPSPSENDGLNMLTDDSEPDQYALNIALLELYGQF